MTRREILLTMTLAVLAVGCQLEEPATALPPSEPDLVGSTAPVASSDSVGALDAPSEPSGPTSLDPTPPADVVLAGAGLVVTVGREVLRLDAEAVRAVERVDDPGMGPTLAVVLSDVAGERLAAMTGANVGKQAVVTLDGAVLVALAVQGRITDGRLPVPLSAGAPADVEARVRAAVGAK